MNTKPLQFVTYEQAKRLKGLGFDRECKSLYFSDDKSLSDDYDLFDHNSTEIDDEWTCEVFSAPTVALALKWFRDEKGFDYSIIKGRLSFEYSYTLLNGTQGKFHLKSHEAAESALLDELLTILEKEKENETD
jgi:hypothetical protein